MSGWMRAALIAAWTGCVSLSTEGARADAPARERVVLESGETTSGALIELVPGDHITIMLASGDIQRISWGRVVTATTITARGSTTITATGATIPSDGHGDDSTPTPQPAPPPSTEPAPPPDSRAPTVSVAVSRSGDETSVCTTGVVPAEADGVPPCADDAAATAIDGRIEPRHHLPADTSTLFDGGHFGLGLGSGIGTPTGYLGALAVIDLTSWLEFEGGAGLGGSFGHALAGMARLQLPLAHVMRFGLGIGISENFLSDTDRAAGAPAKAQFWNFEISQDYAMSSSSFLRLTAGYAWLHNSADFAAMCPSGDIGGNCNPMPSGVTMVSPAKAGWDASNHNAVFFPYLGMEALWMF